MSSKYHQARKDIRMLAGFVKGLTDLDVELEEYGGFEKVKLEAEARASAAIAKADEAEIDLRAKLAAIEEAGKDLESVKAQATGALSDAAAKAQRLAGDADVLIDSAKEQAAQIVAAGQRAAANALAAVTNTSAEHNKDLDAAKDELVQVNARIKAQQAVLDSINSELDALRARMSAA